MHGRTMTSVDGPGSDPAIGSPLQVPIFRAVLFATVLSNFGALIQSVGAAWLMVSMVPSPQMVALVQASTTLPFTVLALIAGAFADSFDRRKVMLCAQLAMWSLSIALSALTWAGWMSPWLLLCFTFLLGCGTAMHGPAWQSAVGDMVPRPHLPSAIAYNSAGFNLARSIGPAIGGALVAAAGAAAAFLVNALSYVALILVLWRWEPPVKTSSLPRERLDVAISAGLRYVWMSPHLRTIMARAGLFGVTASTVSALMPLIARDLIGGGAATYGVLLGAFGVGAVIGAIGNTRLRRRFSAELIARLGGTLLGLGAIVTAASSHIGLTAVSLLFAGAGWVLTLSTFNISVQLASPRWVAARAVSIYQMIAFGMMAVGAWLIGLVAEHNGVATALLIGGTAQLLTMLSGLVLPLPAVQDLNLDPLRLWTEPATAVPIESRSGPVVITIEYRIASDKVLAFLAAMGERRRVRRRDGAHGWTLLRDLHDPELWIERYHFATWADYLRHNQRRTQADAENIAMLQQLQKNGEPLRVHRMLERQTGTLPAARRSDPPILTDSNVDPTRSS